MVPVYFFSEVHHYFYKKKCLFEHTGIYKIKMYQKQQNQRPRTCSTDKSSLVSFYNKKSDVLYTLFVSQ